MMMNDGGWILNNQYVREVIYNAWSILFSPNLHPTKNLFYLFFFSLFGGGPPARPRSAGSQRPIMR